MQYVSRRAEEERSLAFKEEMEEEEMKEEALKKEDPLFKEREICQKFQCHKFGHFRHNCPERSNDRKEKKHASATYFEELPKKPKNENPSNKDFFYFSALTGFVADSEDL